MFVADRQQVLTFIGVLGAQRCAYGTWPDGPCDCKYGYTGKALVGGEQNGCPELRSLRSLISAMTDGEWEMLVERAGGTPVGLFAASEHTLTQRLILARGVLSKAERLTADARELLTVEPEAAA